MSPAAIDLLDRERAAFGEFCAAVRARFGSRVRELALFGDVLVSPFALSAERMTELRDRERLIAREIARDALPL